MGSPQVSNLQQVSTSECQADWREINRMLLAGLAWVIIIEIYCAVMQRSFQDTNNKVGKSFAILGIYLFAVGYCKYHVQSYTITGESNLSLIDALINPVTWIYGAEVLPMSL